MPTPEQVERPPEPVQQIPEQHDDLRERAAEAGVTQQPTAPQQVQDDTGRVIAQPVGDQDDLDSAAGTMQIAIDEATANAYIERKNVLDASYWLGVGTLRRIHQALLRGMRLLVGKEKK